jgi:hypothetical protein
MTTAAARPSWRPSLTAARVPYHQMTEKPSDNGVERGSKRNRKVMIQLLPLIVIIINIFDISHF